MGRPKTLAEQISELEDPIPQDIDPEALPAPPADSNEDNSDADKADGREHYEVVGKSKLRKKGNVVLGPQYSGSLISRDAFEAGDSDEEDPFASGQSVQEVSDEETNGIGMSDEDMDEAQGDSDDAELLGSDLDASANGVDEDEDESMSGTDVSGSSQSSESENDDTGDKSSSDSSEPSHNGNAKHDLDPKRKSKQQAGSRIELRQMMSELEKTVTASISQANQADIEKGQAVRHQRLTFDSLLNTRIRLQKSLIAANTFTTIPASQKIGKGEPSEAYQAAEEAALRLWTTIDDLRLSISPLTSKKRKRTFSPNRSTLSATMWSHMEVHEAAEASRRRKNLEKWSSRVRGPATLPTTRRLNNTSTSQSITDVLASQLADPERLIAKSQIPRSCAPVQASSHKGEAADGIYDDTDFYQALLRELVDQRMGDAASTTAGSADVKTWSGVNREAKTRRVVDTKASKGRKMRYTVHEKLQNFMAQEDRGMWGERQKDELFGSLLGKKMALAENDSEDDQDIGEESLRLFGATPI